MSVTERKPPAEQAEPALPIMQTANAPGAMMIDEQEKQAVLEVLESHALFRYYGAVRTGTPEQQARYEPHWVKDFEVEFARRIGARHALAVCQGTAALHVALIAAGVGPGDEVIVPGLTFLASGCAVVMTNAIPIFVDSDDSLSISPPAIEAAITERTRAIMPVHIGGAPCDMDAIMAIARKHDLLVIEDCAQSCGATYKGKCIGTFGDLGGFSLQLGKIITTGDGGVVTTNDDVLWERACRAHDNGLFREGGGTGIELFGSGFRMPELSGAVARVQLTKLDDIIARMKAVKARVRPVVEQIDGLQPRRLHDPEGEVGSRLVFFAPTEELADDFQAGLRRENVRAGRMYTAPVQKRESYLRRQTHNAVGCPFTCPYYKGEVDYATMQTPMTDDLLARCVTIAFSPMWSPDIGDRIAEAIRKVAGELL